MKKLLLLFILGAILHPWQAEHFPVKNIRITSTFGESRGDHFHTGIDFGDVQEVYPITQSEVLFYKDFTENPTIPTFGSGDFVILAHGNHRSYYFHLQPGSIDRSLSTVGPDQALGIVGNSGHSAGAHLHYVMEDIKRGVIMDPLCVLPPASDNSKPKISSLLVRIKDKLYQLKANSKFHYKMPMELIVVARDLKPFLNYWQNRNNHHIFPCGASRITVKIDGVLHREYDFRRLKKTDKGLYVFPEYPFEEIYGNPFNYKFGTFMPTRSLHVFEVTATDYKGNSQSFVSRVRFL